MDERSVVWEHVTHSFGEPYGAQRGGVEVSVVGPDDAELTIDCAGRSHRISLGDLTGDTVVLDSGPSGELAVQPAVGALLGMGVRELDVAFDDTSAAAFYYARVFQVDGELAWSSPIWVLPEQT
jgi:hypothetical protein